MSKEPFTATAKTCPEASTPPLDWGLRVRLSTIMFLQYGIWGTWLPLLWPFLFEQRGFTPRQIGDAFAVGAVGAILGPFVAGQFVDRYFTTERFLALSHLVAGVLIWQLSHLESYGGFLLCSLVYSVVYLPTVSLTNSLAFRHLPDRDRDYGKVRVWGTVGWIVAGVTIGQWLLHRHTPVEAPAVAIRAAQVAGMADAFRLAAILEFVTAAWCLVLPHTPPMPGVRKNATFAAVGELKRRPLLALFVLAVPVSCINQFYMVHTAGFVGNYESKLVLSVNQIFGVGGGGLMTIGQISEIAVLLLIPLVVKRVSRKNLLGIGIVACAVRMLLFVTIDSIPLAPVVTLIVGIAMHGLCFGCFFLVACMIVDEETTDDVRASAQSLLNLVTIGIGILAGSYIATGVARWATVDGQIDFIRLFTVPLWASVVCWVMLLVFYPGKPSLSSHTTLVDLPHNR